MFDYNENSKIIYFEKIQSNPQEDKSQIPKGHEVKKKKVDIYNTVIWDFILAIKMCFETREKIPCTVHSLKSMRD